MSKRSIKNILLVIAVSGLLWIMWQLRIAILQMGEETRSTALVYYHILIGCIYTNIGVVVYFKFKKNKQRYNQDLHSSEERYRVIFDNSPLGIVHFDQYGTIVDCNKKFIDTLGSSGEKVIGFNLLTDLEDADLKGTVESALEGKIDSCEIVYTGITSGITLNLKVLINLIRSDTGKLLGGVANFEDITDKKHIEGEMARLDRLDLVGQMSASIGHEIRNPMTTVRGFLQLLGNQETDPAKKEYYKVMINELDRANKIITEFLSLAKNKMVKYEDTNVNDIIDLIHPLILGDAIGQDKNVLLKKGIIPRIPLDEREIRQLILNLVRNGLEAMPKGKDLIISTYTEGNELILSVKDEGSGISADVLDKIGRPFLTTKETGTGLGLPVCYSIAQRHQAKICIETSVSGTTFYVRFKILNTRVNTEKAS